MTDKESSHHSNLSKFGTRYFINVELCSRSRGRQNCCLSCFDILFFKPLLLIFDDAIFPCRRLSLGDLTFLKRRCLILRSRMALRIVLLVPTYFLNRVSMGLKRWRHVERKEAAGCMLVSMLCQPGTHSSNTTLHMLKTWFDEGT